MTTATLANPAACLSLCLHGADHLAVTTASVPSTGGKEENATGLLRLSCHEDLWTNRHIEDCPQRPIRGMNCAAGDDVLSPQGLTARGQRRCATTPILRRLDRQAKEAIPEKSDRKATFLHGKPSKRGHVGFGHLIIVCIALRPPAGRRRGGAGCVLEMRRLRSASTGGP